MVADIKRTVKLVTEVENLDKPAVQEGFPMKIWNIQVFLIDEAGNQMTANCFSKVTYNLHPTFPKPVQTFTTAPFRCENEGWGEFEMSLDLYYGDKSAKITIPHDLNFAKPRYEATHTVSFKNPSANLISILRESGPVGDDKKEKKKGGGKKASVVDMEKLADALVKLGEEDLLKVVQMIHDNKTEETYTKNDIEQGEFHVDLYTLPDSLVKMLWDFVQVPGRV